MIAALRGQDHAGGPICTADGAPTGNEIMDALLEKPFATEILGGTMPADPAQVQQFFEGLDRLIKAISSSGYAGKAAVSRASSYRFLRADLVRAVEALATLGEAGDTARVEIAALLDRRDVTDVPLVHDDETSKPAKGLLGSLLTKPTAGQPVTAKDAEDFLKRYAKQQSGIAGKQQDATGGSIKFRAQDVQRLDGAVGFLEQRNALQPEELDQVSSLTRQLAPNDVQ